jgi:phosphoribosylformimino-5-aminoimidazole carboxamide ribotide isomerase
MRIIPVLDLQRGQVVRGIAGRRSEYRPIVSQLTASSLPLDVAEAFRAHFGFNELYLADLDAIAGSTPAWATYAELRSHGFCLWVDAGVRTEEQAALLVDSGLDTIVIGLETVCGPSVLANICSQLGPKRLVFSLDLKAGQPLGDLSAWEAADPWSIAQQAIALGTRRLIILDLERVGTGGGAGTEALCERLAQAHPEAEIVAGGGVRAQSDLDRLEKCGVKAVLVASALHDGELKINPHS